jgi:protein TonB
MSAMPYKVSPDPSPRTAYAVSVALHGAVLAALIYAGASRDQTGVQRPGPPTIEILLPPMTTAASSALEKAQQPPEKIEDVVPEKVPVIKDAVENKSAPVLVAKTDEPNKTKTEDSKSEAVPDTPAMADTPSDAPVKDTVAENATGSSAVAGGGTPGARADFNALVVAWIEKHKRYPDNARRRGLEGRPSMRFRIDRNGQVLSSDLHHATGQQLLDKAAIETITRANPFPPMPPELTDDSIEFIVPIEFSMRR